MTTTDPKTVEDVQVTTVAPVDPQDNEEYLPVAPASGGTTVTPPGTSVAEPTPPAAPAAAAPVEPAAPAGTPPAVAAPAAQEDGALLAQELQKLSTEHKRMPNESLAEYARRLEIGRLRNKLNGDKASELLGGGGVTPVQPVAPAAITPPEAPQLDPEELADFAQKAKAAGFVPKAEIDAANYNSALQGSFDSFIQETPELSDANDPDKSIWKAIVGEFQSGRYNQRPPNPQDLKVILNHIKRDVLGIQPTSGLTPIQAQQAKINVASHTGASPGTGAPAPENPSSSAKKALLSKGLKGFTDEEIDELSKD